MESPREFWIDPEWGFDDEHESDPDENYFGSVLKQHPGQGPLKWQSNLIHVIEKTAFDQATSRIKELEGKLAAAHETIESMCGILMDNKHCDTCVEMADEALRAIRGESE